MDKRISEAIPRIGFLYGIVAQTRSHELSKVQRLMSVNLADNIADQKIYDRLQPVGACLSYGVTLRVMEDIGNHFTVQLKEAATMKKRIRIVGDNVNFSVGQADMRKENNGKMNTLHHTFSSAALVHDFDFSELSDTKPQKKLVDLGVKDFLPNKEDYRALKDAFIFHIVSCAAKFIPYFKFLKDAVKHPESPHLDQLTKKTQVILLDTLHKNEQNYGDVVDIMDSYEKIIEDTFPDLQDIKIHIGGHQLTRERFSGAKGLRAGANDPRHKFEHLNPITFEIFHLQMNFLMIIFKFLYSEKSGGELGTMKCEINRIMRTNVDPDVRKAYDQDKDFVLSFVNAHLVELVCHFFGLENHLSSPTKHVPDDIEYMTEESKLKWVEDTFGKMVDDYIWQTDKVEMDTKLVEDGHYLPVQLKLSNGSVLKLSAKLKDTPSTKQTKPQDDFVKNYAQMVVELGLLFKELLYVSKEPNRPMLLSLLKRCMVAFKAKSCNSKYALEVHRFLMQQYNTLSEREATETLYSMFVNTQGRTNTHIPADLQMEYLVKLIKKHIKHMFSNKTEVNISKRTKSLSGIQTIADHYDETTCVQNRSKHHKHKETDCDEHVMIEDLRKVKPFLHKEGRKHDSFPSVKPSVDQYLNVNHYHNWISDRTVNCIHQH